MTARIELVARPGGEGSDRILLDVPALGTWTCALPKGRAVVAGDIVGILRTAGRRTELVVPEGVAGLIVSERPERVHEPVDYGRTLYELEPLSGAGVETTLAGASAQDDVAGLVVRSPQTGRFWRRAAPTDPPLASEGDEVEAGQALGLIEVMKTFTHIQYEAKGNLPARAKIVRFLIEDGGEVTEGDPLAVVE